MTQLNSLSVYYPHFGMTQVQELGTGNLYYAMIINGGYYWDTAGTYLLPRNDTDNATKHYMVAPLWIESTGTYEVINPVYVTVSTSWYQNSGMSSEPTGLRYICKYVYSSKNPSSFGSIVKLNDLYYMYTTQSKIVWQVEDR